ncbi:MAG: HDIG domain-containing protein [Spirochaetia bacterium]|nr:HDIG domain-containing protein [Spirochaetia bacterium]
MISEKWRNFLRFLEDFFNKERSSSTIKKILAVLFGVNLFLITYLLSIPYLGKKIQYQLGDVAQEDVRVYQDIRYEIEVETEKNRNAVKSEKKFVFFRDYQVLKKVVDEVQVEFSILAQSASSENPYEKVVERLPYIQRTKTITKADVEEALKVENRLYITEWAVKYATLIFDSYGITTGDMPENIEVLKKNGAIIRTINTPSEQKETEWSADKIISKDNLFSYESYKEFFNLGDALYQNMISENAKKLVIHRLLQLYYRKPFLTYSEAETRALLEKRLSAIKPVTSVLKKGLIIVRAGDPVDLDRFEKVQILNKHQNKTNFKFISGMLLIQLFLALGISFYIFRFSEVKFRGLSSHVILHSLIFSVIVFSFIISRLAVIQESGIYFALFVPLGYAAILTGLLYGARVTMSVGVYLSFYLYFLSGYEAATILISFVTVMASIYSAQKMDKRTQFFKGVFITAFAVVSIVVGMDLLSNQLNHETNQKIIIAVTNSFLGVILALGILPVYESVFNIPTKFRLRELSDINHPLLRRLASEAPSTYTHSLMMANLSERVVSAIGGDALLTRVGCLFHDIGKLENPEFYSENRHLNVESKKVKKAGAQKSAKIIIDHVCDGIKKAKEYRLPDKIVCFIPEHHGTSTMQYFYHKALEENKSKKNGAPLERKMFQYPGPKPQSKETAVVMLADSLEAASRTLTNPTLQDIEDLVEVIVSNKINEDQLNVSPLTLSDINIIKKIFRDSLMSSFHVRPKYPTMKETKNLEKKLNDKAKKKTLKKKPENKKKV